MVATAAFGLRLRSLRATGGRAGEAWRQGARLGAGLLLVTAWVGSIAAVRDDPPGAGGEVASVVAALALAAALVAAVGGHRLALVAATAAALAALWAGAGWDPVSTAVAVALGAMVVADGGRMWQRLRAVAAGGGQEVDVLDAAPGRGLRQRPWRPLRGTIAATNGMGPEQGLGGSGGGVERPSRRLDGKAAVSVALAGAAQADSAEAGGPHAGGTIAAVGGALAGVAEPGVAEAGGAEAGGRQADTA
ncbi:MAG TPA: hypothetical protein VFB94_11445, partial [Acidimicrobiales bacterium]|nr:hypothetical protein [Acidimicrobiales bacterium]